MMAKELFQWISVTEQKRTNCTEKQDVMRPMVNFLLISTKKYPCDGHSFVQQLNVTDDCTQSGSCQCGKGAACHVATQAACDDPDDPTFAFLVGQCLYGVIQYQCDEQKG
eukprot:100789_1